MNYMQVFFVLFFSVRLLSVVYASEMHFVIDLPVDILIQTMAFTLALSKPNNKYP